LRAYIGQLERQLSEKGSALPVVPVVVGTDALTEDNADFATSVTPADSPVDEIEREVITVGMDANLLPVGDASSSANPRLVHSDSRSETSYDDDEDGFTRELVVTLSSVPDVEPPAARVDMAATVSDEDDETGAVVSDAEILAALANEQPEVVDNCMQTDESGPSPSEVAMERKLLRMEEQLTLLEQDKRNAALNVDELKADALVGVSVGYCSLFDANVKFQSSPLYQADKERIDELAGELETKLHEVDKLQQSVFALQARLLEVCAPHV
jgi:hypothetical protein